MHLKRRRIEKDEKVRGKRYERNKRDEGKAADKVEMKWGTTQRVRKLELGLRRGEMFNRLGQQIDGEGGWNQEKKN